MRLSEAKIKQAILHPQFEIRERAVRYFSRSHSSDTSVMPLVIQAVETCGREEAYHLIGLSRDIAQMEDTIDWIIGELNQEESEQYENYTYNLSAVLLSADPTLLLPRESDILESEHFLPELEVSFIQRLQMLTWDEEPCWQRLEELCEKGKDKQYVNDFDWSYGKRLVEALAHYGSSCEEEVHALLRQEIEDFSNHPMKWLEPLVVHLAGQARLESSIPLILGKLEEDGGDLLNEACSKALTQIGTPTVLDAVSHVYPTAPHHFRIYASDPLESIRSDLAVEKCLELLHQEQDRSIQLTLAHALLAQFATEGIEEARKLLIGHELNFEGRGLRNQLVETCDLMEETFPEYDEWKKAMKVEREDHRKRIEELGNNPEGLLRYAIEQIRGTPPETAAKEETPVSHNPPTKLESERKVGRNDPCPCGSGKKYKKCCLKKKGDDSLLN